jgi:putative DNA primase/helicase
MNDSASAAPTLDVTGPMPASFKISSFPAPATTSTRPTLREVTFDELVKLLTTHERRRNKDGRGWSGATYKPGTTRANANVVEWSVAGGDLDHFTMDEYVELRDRLVANGIAFIMYSTFNSTDDDFRFRVAIPFTTPVPKAQYTDVWHRINAYLFGGRNDPQTKDASRMLYTPAAPDGVAVTFEHGDGLALDWTTLPEAPASARTSTVGPSTSGQDVGVSRDVLLFTIEGAPDGQQRGMALRAARSFLSAGKTVDETIELVWRGLQASPVGDADNPWTEDLAREIVEDIAGREAPPLDEWPDFDIEDLPSAGRNGHSREPTVDMSDGGFSPARNNGHADGRAETTASATTRSFRWRKCTETGNAERLVDQFGQDLRFCYAWKSWLYWDGRRWKRDSSGMVRRWAKVVMRSIYIEAGRAKTDDIRKAIAEWAKKSETAAARAAMVKLAEAESGIPIETEAMDIDPFLFNVLNGTVDLRTGRLRPHSRDDLITKLAPVAHDASATCPIFVAFLERVLPDPDVRAFVQRAVGYSLTASTAAQCLFFFYGGGANGKSTLLTLLGVLLGDYARHAAPELLTYKKGDRHPTELADLFGARLVTSVEVDEGKRLAETLVKQMTGGDPMKGRFMNQDFFEWMPTHKLFLAANHQPQIRGTDYAIWRRIHLIPFTVTIPPAERDEDLPAKLKAELPGILNWAIAGCLDWQEHGLGVPQAVKDATNTYRAEQDILGDFLAEKCMKDPQATVPSQTLYAAYAAWCEAGKEPPLTQNAFGRALTERGFEDGKGAKGARIRRGIRLLGPDEEPSGGGFGAGGASWRGFSDEQAVPPRGERYRENGAKSATLDESATQGDDAAVCSTDGCTNGVAGAGLHCDACLDADVEDEVPF